VKLWGGVSVIQLEFKHPSRFREFRAAQGC